MRIHTPYGKLVRDNVPRDVRAEGKTPIVRKMDGKALFELLKAKLVEEANEVKATDTRDTFLNELADVQEVVDTLVREAGSTPEELRDRQHTKLFAKGGFTEGFYLEAIDE